MINILILGTGRVGKSTLANLIKERYPQYNIIRGDSLKWAMIRSKGEEQYYRQNVDKQKEFEHSDEFQKTLMELFNSLISLDRQNNGYILESGQIAPKIVDKMINRNNTYIVCLGHGDLTKEEMVENCIKYDAPESWTYGLSQDYLLKHAEDWYSTNEILKVECSKYNIKYIDTSNNRISKFDKIIDEIANINNAGKEVNNDKRHL